MKVYYLIPSFLIACIAVVFIAALSHHPQPITPAPTETIVLGKEEGKKTRKKLDREAFFERMHKTAPGTDWRSIDNNYRYEKYLRNKESRSLRSSGNIDSIANGYLTGTWKERGSANQSGRIVYADIDTISNEVYCASAGGIVWKGNLNGSNWTPLNDQLRINGIIYLRKIHKNSSTRLLCAGSKYIYHSDDDGMTWNIASGLSNVVSWGAIKRVQQLSDSNKTVLALVQEWDYNNWNQINSIYKSTDQGSSFVKMFDFDEPTYGNADMFSLYIPYHEKDQAYLLNDTTLYLIDKNNNSFSAMSHIQVVSHGRVMLTGSKSFGIHYMYAYVDEYIYRSVDGGISWQYATQLAKRPFSRNSFNVSILDPSKVYFGDVECWVSNTLGQTWTKMNNWFDYYSSPIDKLHADIPAVLPLMDANGVELTFVCTDGGLYVSDNQMSSVSNIAYSGLNASQYYSVYTHKNLNDYIYAGSQDQGFQRCTLDSSTVLGFDQLISGDYGHIVSSNNGESVWTVYPGFADYYADAKNSTNTKGWTFNGATDLWLPPLMEDPWSPTQVYLAGGSLNPGNGSHLIKLSYISISNSITATQLPFDFHAASGGVVSAMSYAPYDKSHWYVATDHGKFFHSADSGTSWAMSSAFTGPSAHYFYGSAIHASLRNPGTVFLAGSGYSNLPVFRSDDHGQSFYSISNGLPNTLVYDITGTNDDSLLFAATENGPYVYVTRDNQWYDLAGNSAPDQIYWSVEYVQLKNTIRFGTYGRGIWDFEIKNLYVSKEELETPEYSMSVYPNPASDFIKIIIPENNEEVQVLIYDLSGKRIIDEKMSGGQHGHLDLSLLSSGMHILEVQAGNKRFIEKIIKE